MGFAKDEPSAGYAGDESTLQSASHGSSEQNDGDVLT
jgi:hypothetical protein